MLTPSEVTQILSPTHWHTRAPTATLNEFTTQKLTSQQRFTTSSSSNFIGSTQKISKVTFSASTSQSISLSSHKVLTVYPPKRNTETLCASPKLAKLVNSSQHDSVYYQQ
ncbi:hypothetical protein QL285_044885 [Trifolium repens]|nr:hypothetical protein QL285_044885 [Trifolium repens]